MNVPPQVPNPEEPETVGGIEPVRAWALITYDSIFIHDLYDEKPSREDMYELCRTAQPEQKPYPKEVIIRTLEEDDARNAALRAKDEAIAEATALVYDLEAKLQTAEQALTGKTVSCAFCESAEKRIAELEKAVEVLYHYANARDGIPGFDHDTIRDELHEALEIARGVK